MSQRNVNLQAPDPRQSTAANLERLGNISNTFVNQIAKRQAEQRERSEKAMLLGDATTEELTQVYSAKLSSASAETKAALTSYAREQAEIIGAAKTKAFSPGATQEDKDNYYKTLSQGTSNLESIATYSVLATNDLNIYKNHLYAVEIGSLENRLSRKALNNTDLIEFNAGLASQRAKNIKVSNNANGHATISFVNPDGKAIERDVWASVQAFKNTGQTLSDQVISGDKLLSSKTRRAKIASEVKGFEDLKPTQLITKKFDIASNTEKTVKISGELNAEQVLLDNHKDYLMSKTKQAGFGEDWDQLQILGKLEDSKLKDISWDTFNNINVEESIKQINESGKFEDVAQQFGNQDKKIDKDEYLEIQAKMRDDATIGLAKFYGMEYNQNETVTVIQDQENKYKSFMSDGRTTKNIAAIRKDEKDVVKPLENLLGLEVNLVDGKYVRNDGPSSFNDLVENYFNNDAMKLYVQKSKSIPGFNREKQVFMTGDQLVEEYSKKNIAVPKDINSSLNNKNTIYVVNKDMIEGGFSGGYATTGIEDNKTITFINNIMTNDSKRNLMSVLGVSFSTQDEVELIRDGSQF